MIISIEEIYVGERSACMAGHAISSRLNPGRCSTSTTSVEHDVRTRNSNVGEKDRREGNLHWGREFSNPQREGPQTSFQKEDQKIT